MKPKTLGYHLQRELELYAEIDKLFRELEIIQYLIFKTANEGVQPMEGGEP